eukprot:450194-Rhodomonas_salina.1
MACTWSIGTPEGTAGAKSTGPEPIKSTGPEFESESRTGPAPPGSSESPWKGAIPPRPSGKNWPRPSAGVCGERRV